MILSRAHRRAFALFRCGVAPLRLETGRYEGLPEEQRKCFCCPEAVEDEKHVLLRCPLYCNFRQHMFSEIENLIPDFVGWDEDRKIEAIFANKLIVKICAKT